MRLGIVLATLMAASLATAASAATIVQYHNVSSFRPVEGFYDYLHLWWRNLNLQLHASRR